MAKIEVRSTGSALIHALTHCDNCDWQEDDQSYADMQGLRNAISSHVRKTGHRVTLETGYTNTYFKD